MSLVYTIENTFDDGYPCTHTFTVFATDSLEVARKRFESYRKSCEIKSNTTSNEYILYQWDGSNCKILDRCDDYGEEASIQMQS